MTKPKRSTRRIMPPKSKGTTAISIKSKTSRGGGCTKQKRTKRSTIKTNSLTSSGTGKKKMQYLEDILQNEFGNYIKENYPGCIINGCPAGAHLGSWSQRSKVKDKHYRKGWPDMFIAEARGGFFGFFVELKVKSNKMSNEQLMTLKYLYENGYKVACFNNLDDACRALDEYLQKPHTTTENMTKKEKVQDARDTNALLLKFRKGKRGEDKVAVSKMMIISPKLLNKVKTKTIEDYLKTELMTTETKKLSSHKNEKKSKKSMEILIID